MCGLRLPDFIIGGAPKCATTSLHDILAQHSEIGIPRGELLFFDADDPVTHPDFVSVVRQNLRTFDCSSPESPFFAAYAERFRPFGDARLVGEDSTTYLLSDVAASRIRRMLPDVKLIFVLRDPVARAYSQYWHLVTTGRATVSFERALTAHPSIVLGSTYARPLARYYELFGRSAVQVVLFEDFVSDPQRAVDAVTDFLGAARLTVPQATPWSNRTRYPGSVSLQLLVNRVRRPLLAGRYDDHLGSTGRGRRLNEHIDKILRRVASNPLLRRARPPAMRETTGTFLAAHLSERNRGLPEMLRRDLSTVWPGFTG